MPTALFVSSGGVAPSVSEVTADEPDDDRARALTRRMRELDKPGLAKCDQRGGDGCRKPSGRLIMSCEITEFESRRPIEPVKTGSYGHQKSERSDHEQ